MPLNQDKSRFLAEVAAAAADVVELTQRLQSIQWQYWKLNYGPGNDTQITDAEASAIGATAAQVVAAETAIESLLATLVTQSQISAFLKVRG
jgi:hypothetical protein